MSNTLTTSYFLPTQPTMVEFPVDRLVRVWIPGAKPSAGAGFRFSGDRILTAAHVIAGAGADEIRLWEKIDGKWVSGNCKEIAWLGDSEAPSRDAAVLISERSNGAPAWSDVAIGPWSTDDPWQARFFTSISESNHDVLKAHGSGTEYPEGQECLHPTVLEPKPDSSEVWKGVSGSPLFRVQGNRLILSAVVRAAGGGFGGSLFRGVPLPPLFEDVSFRDALYGDASDFDFETFVGTYCNLLARDLEKDPEVIRAIASSVPECADAALAPEDFAARLCAEISLESVSSACSKAYSRFYGNGEFARAEAVRRVFSMAGPPALVREIGKAMPRQRDNRVDLSVATPEYAEGLVSAIGQRILGFIPQDRGNPKAKYRIEAPPNFSLDIDGRERARDVAWDVYRRAQFDDRGSKGEARKAAASIIDTSRLFPLKRFSHVQDPNKLKEYWERDILPVFNRVLEEHLDEGQFYVLKQLTGEGTEHEQAFLAEVARMLGQLLVVTYQSGEPGQLNREDATMGSPLRKLYKKVGEKK